MTKSFWFPNRFLEDLEEEEEEEEEESEEDDDEDDDEPCERDCLVMVHETDFSRPQQQLRQQQQQHRTVTDAYLDVWQMEKKVKSLLLSVMYLISEISPRHSRNLPFLSTHRCLNIGML